MKKIYVVSVVFILLFSLSAFGSEDSKDALLTKPDYIVDTSESNEMGTNISDNIIILNEGLWSGTMPKISDNGCVIWKGRESTSDPFELFYWDGNTTEQVTNGGGGSGAQINANGVVVWYDRGGGSDVEIFIYDGTNISQLTNNSFDDYNPTINDLGQIAWQAEPIGGREIYFWDGSNITQVTNNNYSDVWPQINNQGQITWEIWYPGDDDDEIFFWDGVNVTQITNNTVWEGWPKLNNNGEVAWASYDGSDPFTQEIFFWDGSSITQITNNTFYDSDWLDINDNGEIAWEGVSQTYECDIFYWNGSNISKISGNGITGGSYPKINNKGHIAWPNCTWVGDNNFDEIYFWDGNNTYRITYDLLYDNELQMNNNDQIVWMSYDFGGTTPANICYIDLNGLNDPEIDPIDLSIGWNLISLPLEQSNESIDQVLSSIDGKWDCIQTYDAINDKWLSNVTYRSENLNDLKTLNHKQGFWINIIELNATFTVSGSEPTSTSINLYAGWNLVGYPSLTNETVANALWGTGADNVMVCNPAEPYRVKEVGPTYLMKPGEGYWVHVPADTVWVVDW